MADAPGLEQTAPSRIAGQLPMARKLTAAALAVYGETTRVDLVDLAYTEAEVLGDWLPD